MQLPEIEKKLKESLQDFKLDQNEKHDLIQIAQSIQDDQRRFIRNKAFELCHAHMQEGGQKAIWALNWLDRVTKAIWPENKPKMEPSAYFSPGHTCRNKIVELIESARESIDVCVFTISDNVISHAILEAHQRRIDVCVISDNDKANDRGSDIYYLKEKGVHVILDNSRYHMHHKFAIFDKNILLNGSFNWTRSASDVNEENILITYDETLVAEYSNEFEKLKSQMA